MDDLSYSIITILLATFVDKLTEAVMTGFPHEAEGFAVRNTPDNPDRSHDAIVLLSAMANPKRLMVLSVLAGGEASVGDLAQAVNLGQSAISQHLQRLRVHGLVSTRRDAQTIYYSVSSPAIESLLKSLENISASAENAGRPAA